MSRVIRKGGLLAVAVSLSCVSVPAQAAMGCWNETQTAAAQVRDLQSRLMVATMRCRAAGIDIIDAYNRFVVANRATLQGANGVLRGHFRLGYGIDGEHQYDRFATALANAYGGDDTDPWACAEAEDMAYEAAAARGDAGRLVHLADRLGPPPRLPGGRCGVSFDTMEPRTEGSPALAQVDPEPAPTAGAGFDRREASSVPRDPLDEIEEIPAPSDTNGEVSEQARPSTALPAKVAPKSRVLPSI